MATAGIDFFRVDRSGATRRMLLIAGILVAAGATCIGAHLSHHFGDSFARLISLAGGVTVISGLILGFGGLAMLVFENVYMLIKEDGLLFHDNGKETNVPWPDLESAALGKEPGYVVFERKGGDPVRWFAGNGAKDLHAKVEEARRKALHGLLKTAS